MVLQIVTIQDVFLKAMVSQPSDKFGAPRDRRFFRSRLSLLRGYGPNCVSPHPPPAQEFICYNPNLQYLRMGLYLEIEPLTSWFR